MRKLLLIARSNMRKAKGQTAAIVVLMLLAALMLNLWLMLSLDYKQNFHRYHDKLNAEHVTLAVDDDSAEFLGFISETLAGDGRVSQYRLDGCMHMVGTFPYRGGTINSEFVFMGKQAALSRSVGRIEIVEEGDFASGIYLPMLYRSEEIAVGKQLEVTVGNGSVRYTVCGFFNSVMMGTHNCYFMQVILTEDKYAELEALRLAPKATLCSVRLADPSQSSNYEAALKSAVSERFPGVRTGSNSYELVSQSRYISQMICSGIVCAMAFLVLLIALVVIVSNIVNYIQVNMQNIGAFKAAGYTSRQLVCSLLVQFLGLTLICAILGTGVSYCVFPAINAMMVSQTGIPYAIRFLPLPVLISLAILCGAVAVSVWLTARRLRRIEPIVALRSGVRTHHFGRNHVPLEKTRAPLTLALALKTTLSGVKHNVTVCLTMMILSLVVVFSGLMFENVINDMTPFIHLIAGETADSCINVQAEIEEEFLQAVNADSRVEKVYLYSSLRVSHVGGPELVATLGEDFSKANNQDIIFKGRFPRYDNEIAVAAKYAKEQGLAIGGEIRITADGRTETYLICGYTQVSNNLGKDCFMTRAGYEKLGALTNLSYYFNLSSGTDIARFNAEMKEKFAENVNTALDIRTIIEGTGSVYVSLMTIIVIAILVLSAIIIAAVLYLLVRTMLNNKRRDYGILKSLGFTTWQLILQTALSFMPAVVLSTAVGLVVSSLAINPLTSVFLSGIGIVKCTFAIPVGFIAAAGLGLVVVSFGIACLLSLKIKRIAPRALLVGE